MREPLYDRCPQCKKEWDDDEQFHQNCDSCGYDAGEDFNPDPGEEDKPDSYIWNRHDVCLNPTIEYNLKTKNISVELEYGIYEGLYYGGYKYSIRSGGGGSGGPYIGENSVGFKTKKEAIKDDAYSALKYFKSKQEYDLEVFNKILPDIKKYEKWIHEYFEIGQLNLF